VVSGAKPYFGIGFKTIARCIAVFTTQALGPSSRTRDTRTGLYCPSLRAM